MTKHEQIEICTTAYNQFERITGKLDELAIASGIKEGMMFVISGHTTTGITVNESLPCLEEDISNMLKQFAPEDGKYFHARFLHSYGAMAGNPTGHLKSFVCGNSCMFPISDGKLARRSAQDIYFCEFDGPQRREIKVTMIGE